jgi:crotonobetainyl-CoA:carnitine CoA-transferase CaiB-like acyl-CoA transferase
MTQLPRALDGVRVLELATVVAGPGAGRYLADFGADVIKIEAPGGDPARRMGWVGEGEEDSYFWKLLNRNKTSISLDLKADSGKAALWALIRDASILIENMRPGKLDELGFSGAAMLAVNPRLVILRISGFGQDGPYAGLPGFATIAEAMSGFSALLGEEGRQPLLPPIALTDELTAVVGAFSALVALRHAEQTGQGQSVDVSLLASMFQIMGPLPSVYAHLGYMQPRMGAGLPYTVPRGTYRTLDGEWVAISCSSDSVAARLMGLLGLAGDARFASFQARSRNRIELEGIVAAWVAARAYADVIAEFRRVDAAVAKVMDMADIFADPHFKAREMIVDVGGVQMQNVVAGLSLTPGQLRYPGRRFDADTQDVLSGLGLPPGGETS